MKCMKCYIGELVELSLVKSPNITLGLSACLTDGSQLTALNSKIVTISKITMNVNIYSIRKTEKIQPRSRPNPVAGEADDETRRLSRKSLMLPPQTISLGC